MNISEKTKEIVHLLFEQGIEITREVLEEILQKAYDTGREDSFRIEVDKIVDNIYYCTMLEINKRKQVLYENNFYNKPEEEAVIEMKALEYLEKHLPQILTDYKES